MSFSKFWKLAKQCVKSLDDTLSPLKTVWIARLHCGCTMTELVNPQLTKTFVEFSRSPTCTRSRHFTGPESGWPQIVDARKATILHCDVSCVSADALAVTEAVQRARSRRAE